MEGFARIFVTVLPFWEDSGRLDYAWLAPNIPGKLEETRWVPVQEAGALGSSRGLGTDELQEKLRAAANSLFEPEAEPEEGESVVWQFQSTGLCEPISIRVAKAESYIIMHMNPLTARVDEEESVIMQ